jgi:hypothetical protein
VRAFDCRVSPCLLVIVLLAVLACSAPAASVPVEQIVHESTSFLFENGSTFVAGCIGLACSNESFEFGEASGEVVWYAEAKATHDTSDLSSSFFYTVFNQTAPLPVTSFRVENFGHSAAGEAPQNWTFTQDGSSWFWQALAPEFGITSQTFLEFSVRLPGLVPVGFGPAAIDLEDGRVLTGENWFLITAVPETSSVILCTFGLLAIILWRRQAFRRSGTAAVILAGMAAAGFLHAQQQPAIRIIQPLNGNVVTSDADVHVLAELAPEFQEPANFSQMSMTVHRNGSAAVFTLGTGDLRWFASPDIARGVWQTRAMPSGQYTVMARLVDRSGRVHTSSIQLTLNRAPALGINVLAKRRLPTGTEFTFQPVVRDTERDTIRQTIWSPGDGTPDVAAPDLAPFTHLYAYVSGQERKFVLTVTVDDVRGARTSEQREVLAGEEPEVLQVHGCGCDKMEIYSSTVFNSFIYCVPKDAGPGRALNACKAVVAPPAGQACPADKMAIQCALGSFAPGDRGAMSLGWGFEINAFLNPATTDVSRCSEGQVARGSLTRGGVALLPNGAATAPAVGPPAGAAIPFTNPPAGGVVNAPNPVPQFGGPNWGSDNYTGPWEFKRHLPAIGRIRWLDTAAFPSRGAAAMTERRTFVSWVQGNLGSCWCQIEYSHDWAAGNHTGPGGAALLPAVTKVAGLNCEIIPGPGVR